MTDETEAIRRKLIAENQPKTRLEEVQAAGGKTWTTAEMQAEFEVMGFLAPFVGVKRRSDGSIGSLEFAGSPRLYFGWDGDE